MLFAVLFGHLAFSLSHGFVPGQLSTSGKHTCVNGNGSVKCWGFNWYGQLGLGDRSDRGDADIEMGDALPTVDVEQSAFVVAGGHHTCAILIDFTVKCWGLNLISPIHEL